MNSLEERIERLAQWMLEAQYLVVFNGAGLSTQ
jgi:NAD-dependent SIR2 family protein deacetylase